MRLKKLEIYGFKSFADRTIIDFDEGITGIVGPNGSGKSNLSEAVRWVLGEQSAKSLRGAKMEDVIFNGTEKRKKLGYCEVSLLFANEDHSLSIDFSEVLITRRAYRTGESEYYINKTSCRLKDVLDLFRDTGIGRDGYSIIGQGRIDDILSQKSDERRGVFEEAAGIVKFKKRKEESEKRLVNTQTNLIRISDVLHELEEQLIPLEKASKIAKKYIEIHDELRILECSSFVFHTDHDTAQLHELNQVSDTLKEQASENQSEIESLMTQRNQLSEDAERIEKELSNSHSIVLQLTKEKEAREGSLSLLRSEKYNCEKEAAATEASNSQSKNQIRVIQEEIDGLNRRKNENTAALEKLYVQLNEADSICSAKEKEVQSIQESLEARQNDVISSMNRLTDVKTSAARLNTLKNELLLRSSEAITKEGELLGEIDSIHDQISDCEKELVALEHQKRELTEQTAETDHAIQELTSNIRNAYNHIDSLNIERSTVSSRLRVLEEMVRDYSGYQQSVKQVLQKASHDDRIHGIVANLITVPKEYEKAIEAVLGGALQHIVTTDEYAARDMIDYLRKNKLGRATFLPISAIRSKTLASSEQGCLAMKGCLGIASELIQYKEIYRGIIENLLGRTVIAADLETGISIVRYGHHAFRLVTLDGDVIHSGGSMTGGSSASRMTSLLSREREISEHKQSLTRVIETVDLTKKELLTFRAEKDQRTEELRSLQEKKQQVSIRHSICQERKDTLCKDLCETEALLKSNQDLQLQIKNNIHDIDNQLERMQDLTQDSEKTSDDIVAETQDLTNLLTAARSQLDIAREKLHDLNLAIAIQQKDMQEVLRSTTQQQKTLSDLQATIIKNEDHIQELLIKKQQIDDSISKDDQEQKNCADRLLEAQQILQKREETRRRIITESSKATERIESLNRSLSSIQEKIHKTDILINKIESSLEQTSKRIWEDYELSYSDAKQYFIEDFEPSRDESRVLSLRQQLRTMGPVNLGATEDYRLCKERFDQLSAQKDDLIKARDDLKHIIETIEKQMEVQFLTNFRLLQTYLSETFSKLFLGGKAELRLSDEHNVLTSGIEIAVQPPGKKLQMLSLLSGGERALTAIAILFAMLKLKPTPFCFLDEIEAALDDGNIETFATYLKDFSKDTQFVIVTHRKGTMEHCDCLYGISMEEKGVSRMLSVELKDIA